MNDRDCVALLQWALPRLGHRWEGYRHVRRQVCRRIAGRMQSLGLNQADDYRAHLKADAAEWVALGACLRVTVSRFFRDRAVFGALAESLLPELAGLAQGRGEAALRAWSAGCASGEEPYSLSILWAYGLQARWPRLALDILASDVDSVVLRRAQAACYSPGSLREVPADWAARGFVREQGGLCLRPELRGRVRFIEQDLCATMPDSLFHLILCRNLAFTYFASSLQQRIAQDLRDRLVPGGVLILGSHERLPADVAGLVPWRNEPMILRRDQAVAGQA